MPMVRPSPEASVLSNTTSMSCSVENARRNSQKDTLQNKKPMNKEKKPLLPELRNLNEKMTLNNLLHRPMISMEATAKHP